MTGRPTPVHPYHSDAVMPYAPAVRVDGPARILFLSGCTGLPLYHEHPHLPEETVLPDDIGEQTRRAAENVRSVLETEGLGFRDIVKLTLYLTDMREVGGMHAVLHEYLGEWRPATTLVCVNSLSAPGARFELDAIAVGPPAD